MTSRSTTRRVTARLFPPLSAATIRKTGLVKSAEKSSTSTLLPNSRCGKWKSFCPANTKALPPEKDKNKRFFFSGDKNFQAITRAIKKLPAGSGSFFDDLICRCKILPVTRRNSTRCRKPRRRTNCRKCSASNRRRTGGSQSRNGRRVRFCRASDCGENWSAADCRS